MTKRIFIVLTIMLVATTVFFAQPIDKLKERLNLTDEQGDKIVKLMGNFHKKAEAKELDIKEQRIKLKRVLLKDNPDEDKIKNILDKIATLRSDLEFAKIKNALKIKKILTPEQFLQWQGMMGDGPRDHRRGNMGDGPRDHQRGNMGDGPMDQNRMHGPHQ